MAFDLNSLLKDARGQARAINDEFMNPVLGRVLDLIGFQHEYVEGEGCYLTGKDGNRYYDALSGYGVFALGRNHPKMIDAIKQGLDAKLPSLAQMDTFLLSALLAKKLISISPPSLKHVFFTNSGTEAVEGAIKFARATTGRTTILHQPSAFHGLSTGALSLNGDESFREGFGDLLPGSKKTDLGDLEQVEAELRTRQVAAVILELVRGKGVLLPKDDSHYGELQNLCRKHGTLFVVDEIQTGLGRTGKWWACEHWNLEPDILTCAKALSGGLIPVGAILYSEKVYSKVFSRLDRCVVHSSTFGQNGLAMVAGLAALETMAEEKIPERSAVLGARLLGALKLLEEKHEFVKEVRGKGMMIGIEFGAPNSLRLKPAWALLHAAENGLFAQGVVMGMYRDHKILSQVAGHHMETLKLLPPLVSTEKEIDDIALALDRVLESCKAFPGPLWSVGRQLATAAARQHLGGK